jgi:hypothetical protein
MFRKLLISIIFPFISSSQYYGERCIEQSFEQSSLYFNSHYLNTFSIYHFKDIAVGFVDEPFLNLYLNPACLPPLEKGEIYLYFDSRGDRKSPTIIENRVVPLYSKPEASSYVHTDSRWFSTSRCEPEPILSFGILTSPFTIFSKRVIFGGTYQIIHKEEQYYTMPYWIYNSRYGYNAFDERAMDQSASYIPYSYSSGEKMINEGHLVSAFCGLKYSDNFTLGLSINSVFHIREGNYLDIYNAPYASTSDSWGNSQFQERTQNYEHFDLSFGIQNAFSSQFIAGIKVGYLLGEAKQKYLSETSYRNDWTVDDLIEQMNYYYSSSLTDQKWDHDGYTNYFNLNIKKIIAGDKEMLLYYRYTFTDVDLVTNSNIIDSTNSLDHWDNHNYHAFTSIKDMRHGEGSRDYYLHEGMINFSWKFKSISTIRAGIYFSKNVNEITNVEPVTLKRTFSQDDDSTLYYTGEYRDFRLAWRLKSQKWSLQIPVLINLKLKEKWNVLLAITRILSSWRIKDQTTAYYKVVQNVENGEIIERRNFTRIFRKPAEIITEDCNDIVLSVGYSISPGSNIKLIIDPQFKDKLQLNQYWLCFETKM